MTVKKFIDIDKVLCEKAPGLRKWLPVFMVSWLKRKLHEDGINEIMNKIDGYYGLEYNRKGFEEFGAQVVSVNPQNVPLTGGITVAANHPLGGLDGMALIKAVGDIRPDVRFFVNDVLKNIKNYGDVFVGVNKVGSSSTQSLRVMESIFISRDAVLFFPAGLVSRKINGKIVDLEWKKSFVTQAIDHKRQIVPVFVEGANSKFFYSFANWRKRIGIKANIEMLLLPDEMFKQRGKTVKIHFGKAFDYTVLDARKSHRGWAATIKDYVYSPEFLNAMTFEDYLRSKGI